MPTRALIHSLVETAPHLAWSNRPDGSTEFINRRMVEYSGLSERELTENPWALVHPEDIPPVVAIRDRHIAQNEPYAIEYRLRRADGVYRWHAVHVAPLRQGEELVAWYGSAIDIDDRHRQLELLDAIFGNSPYGIAVLRGRELERKLSNRAYDALLGPDPCMFARNELLHTLETGTPWIIDNVRVKLPGGLERVWQGRAIRLGAAPGDEASVLFIARDATEEAERQAAIQEREAMLDAFFAASPNILTLLDEQTRFLNLDPTTAQYLGLTREQVIGKTLEELHPVYRAVAPVIQHVIRTGQPISNVQVSAEVLARGGEMGIFQTSFFPVPLPGGKRGVGSAAIEITEMKRAERALRTSEERFRSLVQATSQIVWAFSPSGEEVEPQPAWQEFTGQSEAEALGWGWLNAVHPQDREAVQTEWQRCLEARSVFEAEYRVRRHDGEWRWMQARAVPVFDESGSVREWVGASSDITQRKMAEEALRKSNEDLERFAFVAGHDLQEPLRQVIAYSELLALELSGRLTAETTEYLNVIVQGTKKMHALIRNLLRQAGPARRLESESVNSGEALADAMQALAQPIREAGGTITAEGLPIVVAPRPVLTQVFQNLLSNALKYRDEQRPPSIRVSGERVGKEWIFSVSDNGRGIPLEYRDLIFAWFTRAPGNEIPGTGVGLASVERMLQRIGGRIWVESEPGAGSTFYFAIPVPASAGED